MADELDEIRRRVDLVELVSQRVLLKRSGKNYTGLCPFHEDKRPSFSVSPHIGRYRCWSCGEKGDAFTWVMKTQNVEFPEALDILAKLVGVTLSRNPNAPVERAERTKHLDAMAAALAFFKEKLSQSDEARAYLDRRGLDEETIQKWELGYAPSVDVALTTQLQKAGFQLGECQKLFLVDQDPSGGYFDKFRGRLIFPIRDERGELVAFGGRLLGDGIPKYINSSDTPLYRKSRVLYGMHRAKDAISKARRAVLVEGYLDVIACHRAEVPLAVASLGTSLSEEHAKLLRRWCEEVVILYDADAAGQKAAERALEVLAAEGVKARVALMPQGEDPDTLLRHAGPQAVQKAASKGLRPLEYRIRSLEAAKAPDDEGFWTDAVELLARATNDLEVDRFVSYLAPKYPGLRDMVAAQQRLRSMISERRASLDSPRREESGQRSARSSVKVEMVAAERTLFLAVLDEAWRDAAWPFATDESLMLTSLAAETAGALRTSFAEAPRGTPAEWIHLLSEEVRDVIELVELQSVPVPLNQQTITDAAAILNKKKLERETAAIKAGTLDADSLQAIQERLRKKHGVQQRNNEDSFEV